LAVTIVSKENLALSFFWSSSNNPFIS
jgi:hypothetical protein